MISIVICSHNREDLIEGCLNSIKNQTADFSSFEVLVVDNNSSDNTVQLIKKFEGLPNLHLFFEEFQGLSYARNRGLKESNGNYIAYVDDDSRIDENYIENLFQLLRKFSDTIDCYGGPILPFYTTPKPDWFEDSYEIRRLRPNPGFQIKGQTFSGSNMIWKKSVLMELGGFNPQFGMKGNQIILGEETKLFNYLWNNSDPKFYYSPDLIVYHWVSPKKFSLTYRLKRSVAIGQALIFQESSHNSIFKRFVQIGKLNILIIRLSIKSVIKIFTCKTINNWIEEYISPIMIIIGKILALLGIRIRITYG